MNTIEWKITEQEMNQELVSGDGRWRIQKTRKGDGECSFRLANRDLMLMPRGTGNDCRTCFESFIRDCDLYIEKVRRVRRDAEEYAASLSGTPEGAADED